MHWCKRLVVYLLIIAIALIVFLIDFSYRRRHFDFSTCHPETKLSADPESCLAYYDCYTGRRRLCPERQCFDETSGRCTEDCDECFTGLCTGQFGNTALENSCGHFLLCIPANHVVLTCASRHCFSASQRICVANSLKHCKCLNRN
ncbi:ORF73 [Leucania separata nucleopolyhedrovirus]|uniref:ORF73 n=1 Tax=Leucania separata nucleopolyhedrovirus TaxID=1307956 RepID=Q0IL46_NPVLS|nr:ORF73 [Leucania separata nucleopolyhedrovirus]AAR28837.1 ORF73 [Leucania separata nucleopolyhedrovirus]